MTQDDQGKDVLTHLLELVETALLDKLGNLYKLKAKRQ